MAASMTFPNSNSSLTSCGRRYSLLHAPDRRRVLEEAFRVLKPGGDMIFTDPMQADDVPDGVLQPVYQRLNRTDLGSMRFYREAALALGFEVLEQVDLVYKLRTHYDRVRQELEVRRSELEQQSSSAYLDKMLVGLKDWVAAADNGFLAWGIQHFRKPC
jgi:ubiquinone/menaquinone biosynthesis C-methylase UbiE